MKELEFPFDSELLLKKRKAFLKLLPNPNLSKKIAILGGSTTSAIREMLELFLINNGIKPIFYESHYGQYWNDSMFNSNLNDFSPDLIFIHTTYRNITELPQLTDTEEITKQKLERQFHHFESMWKKLKETYQCPIIQNNFERPCWRLLGNRDVWDHRGKTNFVNQLNQKMYSYAQTNQDFYINDIDYLASTFGLEKWHEHSYWYMYKYAQAITAVPELAFSVSNIIKSIYGKNKKALVLDLDNTLWSGTIGENGRSGINLAPENSVGEAFIEFQHYIKEHSHLGVLLTIASKNDYDNAIDGLEHPNGHLKPENFVIIKADWNNKNINIQNIASELNIDLNSLVFIDDNPQERAIVNQFIPQVSSPEMTSVENYINILNGSGYFEATSLTTEDSNKSTMYIQNEKRKAENLSYSDYNDFLKSLEMLATIKPFDTSHTQRITQLINKTNQFNLTTKRFSESEILKFTKQSDYIHLYGILSDKFGDNGLVTVMIGRKNHDILDLELWLMSCRVFKRNMELAMLDHLAERAIKEGIKTLKGYFFPTSRNTMVKDFYNNLGFQKVFEDKDGNTQWTLNLESYTNKNNIIQTVKN